MTARITSYGGRVMSLHVMDKNGHFDDVVMGYDTVEDYINSNEKYYGAIIGRYGNRIGGAGFSLDGQIHLVVNFTLTMRIRLPEGYSFSTSECIGAACSALKETEDLLAVTFQPGKTGDYSFRLRF